MTETGAQPNVLPLAGIQVVELSHMVMGPSAGMILADLGAQVIKVEPPGGDKTRQLKGSGAGYFAMYNRNKRSLTADLLNERDREMLTRLISKADVLIENFRPGALEDKGFGYDAMAAHNPELIYCSARGFLPGPYAHRVALDEVVQMMGGLAYMTGPPGRPLRAGASVIDIMGGMFGVIGILAALEERRRSGRGQYLTSSLYESTAFLMGQHMAQYVETGAPAAPMPERVSAWAIYDVFLTADEQKLFVGVVSDTQWRAFCDAFDFKAFASDADLAENSNRVDRRDEIIPQVTERFLALTIEELIQKLDTCGLPYAPIARPEDLFEDEHLVNSGGLLPVEFADGKTASLPALPLSMSGARLGVRRNVPKAGEHTKEIQLELDLR